MKKVLLTNHYSGLPLEIVQESLEGKFELISLNELTKEELISKIPEADYLLVSGRMTISEEILKYAKKLKMVQRTGVGLDNIDLPFLKEIGLPLYVNQGVNSQSVAEHALLLMLASLRKLTIANEKMKCGVWEKHSFGVTTHELSGKEIGLIGFGNIAKKLSLLLQPFNVKIRYYDAKRLSSSDEKRYNVAFSGLDDLLSCSDIISLHCPLTDNTHHIINNESIKLIKKGAILINTARGGLIDSNDLADALICGKLSFAALDVHEEEPISNDYILGKIDNVILTPHIAGVTYDSFRKMIYEAVSNIEEFDKGNFDKIKNNLYAY